MKTKTDVFNLNIKFLSGDAIGRSIYKRGCYDMDISQYIMENIQFQDKDVFLDIGANIGWYSLLLGKNNSNLTIYSFEPDPINLGLLKENVKNNHLKNITIIPKALSDRTGSAILYKYPNKNAGRHSLLPINDYQKVKVETQTLNEFIKEVLDSDQIIRFIKIDVEGFEFQVFKYGEKALERTENVLLEFTPEYMKIEDKKDFVNLLQSLGFQCYIFKNGQTTLISYKDLHQETDQINLILKRE